MPTGLPPSRLEREARALVERLAGRWTPSGGMCRCPAHDDRTPSLSVRVGRLRLLLHCFAGCEPVEILNALKSMGLLGSLPLPGPDGGMARPAPGRPGGAIRLWKDAGLLAGTPAECYFAGRGIGTSSPELRYHPRTPHGPKPSTQFRPAMIAAVRDDNGLVAAHRTFLDPASCTLADIAAPRCALGRLGRGAVRLGGVARRLGLAEGIETALSATALFGLPCWATLGTERFRHVALPNDVTGLLLFLDNDDAGRRAEALARDAFGHLAIEAHYPPSPGEDWNDVLRRSAGCSAAG